MSRNFYVTGRQATGASAPTGRHYAQDTQRDLEWPPKAPNIYMQQLTDATRDVIAASFVCLFVASVSAAFLFSLFILFFVRT